MADGRTDEWRTDRRTDGWLSKNVFQPFLSHIRVLSKRIKREYGPKKRFQPFSSHIRVLSKRIKRGYGQKNVNAVIGLNIPTIPVKI
jgi:hypothetical protein